MVFCLTIFSYDDANSLQGVKVESSTYTRTWEQNEELGLPQPCESAINNEASDENVDPVAKLADLLAKSNKIVAFTGAGISVGMNKGVTCHPGDIVFNALNRVWGSCLSWWR